MAHVGRAGCESVEVIMECPVLEGVRWSSPGALSASRYVLLPSPPSLVTSWRVILQNTACMSV